jgi:hypothetical protein
LTLFIFSSPAKIGKSNPASTSTRYIILASSKNTFFSGEETFELKNLTNAFLLHPSTTDQLKPINVCNGM